MRLARLAASAAHEAMFPEISHDAGSFLHLDKET